MILEKRSEVGLGLDGNYTKFGDKTLKILFPARLHGKLKSTVVLAVAKYVILPEGKALPYLLAVLGYTTHP